MKIGSRRAAVLAQSGGPTPVLNATLLGVVEAARLHPEIAALYGARFGIVGVLEQDFIDLFRQTEETLHAVARSPSSALGTSRRELTDADLLRILDVFHEYNVGYFFYNGGNGSMRTAHQIQTLAGRRHQDLQVMGIPKTIDNDLLTTDHSPGYGSAARFFALAARDIGADNRALPGQVEFIEVLGRNAGWLAAATSLARFHPGDPPHLIYLPETLLPLEQLLEDVHRTFRRLGRCVIAVCEGQLDEHGEPFGADVRSGSRGALAMNLAHRLALLVIHHLKIRARSEKPGLLGRASALCVSQTDWSEARLCGVRAVSAAIEGQGGKMVTLLREHTSPYSISAGLASLEEVAFAEKQFPVEWRNAERNDVRAEFRDYAMPLVGSISSHRPLDDNVVPKRTPQ